MTPPKQGRAKPTRKRTEKRDAAILFPHLKVMSCAEAMKEKGQRRRPGLVRLEQRQVAHLERGGGRGEGGLSRRPKQV